MANDQNERTEDATAKRLQTERNKGNIAKSQDFTSSLLLACGLGLMYVLGNGMLDKLKTMLIETFSNLNPDNISNSDTFSVMAPFFKYYVNITALFFVLIALAAIAILRYQTGSLFAKEAIKPNFGKLSPSNALKGLLEKFNLFKPRQIVELVKSLTKTAIVALVGMNVIIKRKDELFGLLGATTSTGLEVIGSVLFQLLLNICIILLIIGVLDRKYQEWEYRKSIKMTKQEVKDERKNEEGDTKVKGRIRSFGMKILQQKMMSRVKEADVVVVNPTHYAVALMYNPEKVPAPVVLAKGVDFIAFKIREIAKNNNIPIVENKPLARSLYKLVDINQVIPQELYVAVAEILQYVYSNKNK